MVSPVFWAAAWTPSTDTLRFRSLPICAGTRLKSMRSMPWPLVFRICARDQTSSRLLLQVSLARASYVATTSMVERLAADVARGHDQARARSAARARARRTGTLDAARECGQGHRHRLPRSIGTAVRSAAGSTGTRAGRHGRSDCTTRGHADRDIRRFAVRARARGLDWPPQHIPAPWLHATSRTAPAGATHPDATRSIRPSPPTLDTAARHRRARWRSASAAGQRAPRAPRSWVASRTRATSSTRAARRCSRPRSRCSTRPARNLFVVCVPDTGSADLSSFVDATWSGATRR